MNLFESVSNLVGLPVPLPKITRMGEVRNPVYRPVPAVAHLANQRPAPVTPDEGKG